ncbi:MAG: 50S ribosomal protein L13 [Elusimicrobia bacterium ADurb.Bin231]|nr:MAG: 50S ribosomal protein L13 [Elusimicrobia bacterium ADurb.Bin231]
MVTRNFYLIDGNEKVLGRLATFAAGLLQGKGKAEYAPHKDIGDFIIVKNASKIRLTGKKLDQKIDFRHSGYPRGDKYMLYKDLIVDNPEKMVRLAISGMLPKNRLRAVMLRRLKVFKNDAPQMEAKCQKIEIKK